jgi:glycosyltransferase involved in cell wall biosynthesis
VIHINQISDALTGMVPSILTGVPIVSHVRSTNLKRPEKFYLNRMKCNICISRAVKDKYIKNGNGIVIHNGIDVKKFDRAAWGNGLRNSFHIDPGSTVVGCVGRITPEKGQIYFIESIPQILKSHPKTRFLIVGDIDSARKTPYLNDLKVRIRALGLDGRVFFTGQLKNIQEAIASLDIVVVPSLEEPFGRIIIESMAMRKPVISTKAGGPLDIITDRTGMLVPPRKSEALTQAVIEMIGNREKRKKLGIEGRKRVEKYFTIDRTVAEVTRLYSELLKPCRVGS